MARPRSRDRRALDVRGIDVAAGRRRVAAVPLEEVGAGVEGPGEVEAARAAGRAAPRLHLGREHERRAAELLGETPGDEADDPDGPVARRRR